MQKHCIPHKKNADKATSACFIVTYHTEGLVLVLVNTA